MGLVFEQFTSGVSLYGQRLTLGTGSLEQRSSALRFVLSESSSTSYSDAQIDDYRGLSRRQFLWRPPLRLSVRARFSAREGDLQGTGGFGFWNDPFLLTEPRLPALPRASWFFYASPASNMKLDWQIEGHGWKAATLDASRSSALLWLPLAPVLVPLMNIAAIYRLIWPPIQRTLRIREAHLQADMTRWHTYMLEWGVEQSRFSLLEEDSPQRKLVLQAPSPRGPLGFVMWLDNQYLVATPWGRLHWGFSGHSGEQWMEVDWFKIEPLGEPKDRAD
jgi:hypothetical protein